MDFVVVFAVSQQQGQDFEIAHHFIIGIDGNQQGNIFFGRVRGVRLRHRPLHGDGDELALLRGADDALGEENQVFDFDVSGGRSVAVAGVSVPGDEIFTASCG